MNRTPLGVLGVRTADSSIAQLLDLRVTAENRTGEPDLKLEAGELEKLLRDKPPEVPRSPQPPVPPALKRGRRLLLAVTACAVLTAGAFFLIRTAFHWEVAKSTSLQASEKTPPAEPGNAIPASELRIGWGDTLWRIAERFYGERGLYRELAESNALRDPDRITAGESLVLPPALADRDRKNQGE